METHWYIYYPHKSLGVIRLLPDYIISVKNVFWYLDNDINLEIYETLLPSPILDFKEYDYDTLEFFNKLYFILHKIMIYADNTVFIRDYLSAFASNSAIHKEFKEKLYFFQCLKKVIYHFNDELDLPASINRTVAAIISDLIFIVENVDEITNEKKQSTPNNKPTTFEINNEIKADEVLSRKTHNPFTNFVNDMQGSNKTRKTILAQFDTLSSSKKWRYAFKDEAHLNVITELLVSFFTKQIEIELPSEMVKLNLNTKTKVARCIKAIYNELGEGNLKNEVKLFEIIKCMSHFKNDTRDQIYKLMHNY